MYGDIFLFFVCLTVSIDVVVKKSEQKRGVAYVEFVNDISFYFVS